MDTQIDFIQNQLN